MTEAEQTERTGSGSTARLRLVVDAVAALGPWGEDLRDVFGTREPIGTPEVPPVPGFIESTFNPLLYAAARRCLESSTVDVSGAATAVLLGSTMGDATTTDLASRLLVSGQVHNPLLFMQASANSVLGFLSREFGITGPMTCLSASQGLAGELFTTGAELLDDPELARVLILGVELAPNARTRDAYRQLGTEPPGADVAVAFLVRRGEDGPRVESMGSVDSYPLRTVVGRSADMPGRHTTRLPADGAGHCGNALGLVHLAAACTYLTEHHEDHHEDSLLVHDPAAPEDRALLELTGRLTTERGRIP